MEDKEIKYLQERKQELEKSLKKLAEIIERRNDVLAYFEKDMMRKTVKNVFSYLGANSKATLTTGIILVKKSLELDLKLYRRNCFYLEKRKRYMTQELLEVNNKLELAMTVGTTNPSP